VNTGRDFIGIDIEADHCEISRRRIEHAIKERNPQYDLPLP
jgi:DNA modification methylase